MSQPNRIREMMQLHGLSYRDVARLLGCSASTIEKLANGKLELRKLWAKRLATVFQVDWLDLHNIDDNQWHLNHDERELITNYRQIEQTSRSRVAEIVKLWAD